MSTAKDISVIRVDSTTGCAEFRFGVVPRFVSGLNKVVQDYMLALLTNIGDLNVALEFGGGMLAMVPRNFGNQAELDAEVAAAVSKAKEDVLQEQARHAYEPDERLRSVTILEAHYNSASKRYHLTLEIRSEVGRTMIVRLK